MNNETTHPPKVNDVEVDDLRQRIEQLETDNERLRRQVESVYGPDNPDFDPILFQSVLQRYTLLTPLAVLVVIVPLAVAAWMWGPVYIGPVPLFDFGGEATGHPGFGLGVVAFGGLSIGVIAAGGCACGVIALGGGSFGLVAIGGGSIGLIAMGGGAVGYIAIGGGAYGRYALGRNAYGTSAFGMNRQDTEAVLFFTRYLPKLCATIAEPTVEPKQQKENPYA